MNSLKYWIIPRHETITPKPYGYFMLIILGFFATIRVWIVVSKFRTRLRVEKTNPNVFWKKTSQIEYFWVVVIFNLFLFDFKVSM